MYACLFRCNLPSPLLAERSGSFTCYYGNTGVQRTPKKSQQTKLTLEEKKILPPLLPGLELASHPALTIQATYMNIASIETSGFLMTLPATSVDSVWRKEWNRCARANFHFQKKKRRRGINCRTFSQNPRTRRKSHRTTKPAELAHSFLILFLCLFLSLWPFQLYFMP